MVLSPASETSRNRASALHAAACSMYVRESGVGRGGKRRRWNGWRVRTWQGFEKFHFWTLHVFVSKMRKSDDLKKTEIERE